MTAAEMTSLVLRSIRRRPRQLLLVAACCAVSATTAAALGGFAARARQQLGRELRVAEPNLIVRSPAAAPAVLDDGALFAVAALPGVAASAGWRVVPGGAELVGGAGGEPRVTPRDDGGGGHDLIVVTIVDGAALRLLYPSLAVRGRLPGAGEALLGERVAASREFPPPSPGAPPLPVAGVALLGTPFDDAVLIVRAAARAPAGALGAPLDRIEARVEPAALEGVRATIERTVPGAEASAVRRVQVTEAQLLRRVSLLLLATTLLVVTLSGAAAAAASSAVVAERRHEVGLLLALGMSPRVSMSLLGLELALVSGAALLVGALAGDLLALRLVDGLLGTGVERSWLALPLAATLALLATAAVLGTSLFAAERRLAGQEPVRLLALD